MKDFLQNEININDDVIYIKNQSTGSSSTRKIMFKGKCIAFNGKKVVIKRLYTNEYEVKDEMIDTVFPKDVVDLKRVIENANN